jgi:hypothetical protein
MWVTKLVLGLAALYAAIVAVMYFAQTWLIFPTALAGLAQVSFPRQHSAWRSGPQTVKLWRACEYQAKGAS